ncbi:MAG: SDR family NAD(P)-dependent oxidoreductase [Proteobacteria bacterium]|nr:SDR family NAD(P)-dependent oxidoreductase [Pseudomonadota bacterium]
MAGAVRPVLLVTGAGEGLGASLAGTFAAAGYDVVGVARSDRTAAALAAHVGSAGGSYTHLACDVAQPDALAAALAPHAGRVAVLVHNAHELLIRPFAETTPAEFERVWRVTCLGAFAAAQIAIPPMAARGAGTVIFSGATAGLRAGAKFAAFASAKFALRGLAQSLARQYGPAGVHVVHAVLDGLIDAPQTEARFGPARAARMDPDAVARVYLDLAAQHPTAWTQELDLRPAGEPY